MKHSRMFATWGGVLASAALVSFIGLTPASADEADPLTVLADVVPSVLAEAAPIEVDQSQDVGQVDVTVASDAAEGISLSGAGVEDLSIGLPFAEDAQFVANNGEPFFDNGNGSSTVPLVKDDGTVQILTTIDNADAPSTYAYNLDVADGSSLSLTATGGAVVMDSSGNVTLTIAEPWALDANGDSVPTHYTLNGTTLTQVIEFTDTTAFPVIADPKLTVTWWNKTLYFSKVETAVVAAGAASASWIAGYFGVPGKVISGALQGYAAAFGIYLAAGKCGKLVNYAHVSAPIPQPYSGSEAGGYCK